MRTIKYILMGEKGVGKSSLLEAYLWKLNCGCVYHDHIVNENRYLIDVIEITSIEELQEQVSVDSVDINIYLLCFNVTDRKTLITARNDWILEILKIDPVSRIFLVGLQCDLRENLLTKLTQDCVSYTDGVNVCLYYQNVQYLECSSIKLQSVKELFDEALQMTLYMDNIDVGADEADDKIIKLYEEMKISFKFKDCGCKEKCDDENCG